MVATAQLADQNKSCELEMCEQRAVWQQRGLVSWPKRETIWKNSWHQVSLPAHTACQDCSVQSHLPRHITKCRNKNKYQALWMRLLLDWMWTCPIHGYVRDWLSIFAELSLSEELREDPTETQHNVSCLPVAPRLCSTIRGSLQSCYILNLFAVSTSLALAHRPLCLSMLGTARNKKLTLKY